jgi:hypothetical protein
MTADTNDAARPTSMASLTALGEDPDSLMRKYLAGIEQPNPRQAEDFQRYVNDLKRAYGHGLLSMYKRIESHGRAICELTAETEITESVRQIMTLVALDGEDVPRVLASFDDAAGPTQSWRGCASVHDHSKCWCRRATASRSAGRVDTRLHGVLPDTL